MTSDFDATAEAYDDLVKSSISFGGQEHEFYTRRKANALVDLATRHLGDAAGLRVLDVGCGIGLTDRALANRFGELHGVDPAEEAVARAVEVNPGVQYRVSDPGRIPHDDGTFDLAFAVCVLHHVDPDDRPAFLRDIARVVRPGGLVALFEHNPRNPLTRLAVSRCEFDEGVVLLGRHHASRLLRSVDLTIVERRYLLFFPFDRRWTVPAERPLAWLPLGAQHYVVGRR